MLDDILAKRGDGLLRTEDGVHFAEFLLALFDGVVLGILRHDVIFSINEMQNIFIQFQMDDSALIIDWAGRAILHGLGHIIDVDVIAEHLDSRAVFA